MQILSVVAAIIYFDNKVLCVQRPPHKLPYISKKFEFPGGKIEEGETREEALHRELLEELCIQIRIKSFFMTVEHTYPDFQLIMHSFICEVKAGEIVLNEHIDYKWLKVEDLPKLDWAAADLPIVNALMNYEGRNL